ARANRICEYCLIHEEDTFFGCEVDHVISQKHGGPTEEDNLALACLICNRNKGSDIASLSPKTRELVRLFNPRTDRWLEHFAFAQDGFTIEALTPIGEATVRILGLNDGERLLERQALQAEGRYPPEAARRLLAEPDSPL
ncbi:MAG TPA: HNH endonuclease signature motif containing protein, partial [Thermoanaerobaculia bacterium]|nr:HNH endonuclease signature motif containing protein [Thermoanaerobaculia bacterium]